MSPLTPRLSWLIAGSMIASAVVLVRADDAAPDSSLGIIRYRAPAGWQSADRAGAQAARVFTAPDSNAAQQAIILLVLSPAKDAIDLGAEFDAAVKEVTGSGKVLESGELTTTRTRQGFDAVTRTLVAQLAGDQRAYVRMVAAKVGDRMAGIYYLASTQELYDQYQPAMGALLQSVSFDAAGGAVAAKLDPAAARAEVETLEKQKRELLAKVAAIEDRQRQLGASTAAAPGGAPAATDAPRADDQRLLADARAQFAASVAARRKPHTIAGDIRLLDGKPIPNVAAYRVFVWGTTVAAERANYGVDVDRDGHFEQQVPDGLYQVSAYCTVDNAGHRVPVDLAWLDDKQGVNQSSAAGIVRDFRLANTALRPGADPKRPDSYFGGVLTVTGPDYDLRRGQLGTRHPGARVQVALEPLTALVDGSRGQTLTRDLDAAQLNASADLRQIPLGAYRVTATLVERDGTRRGLTCSPSYDGTYRDSADIFWEGSRDNPEARANPRVYVKD